MHSLTVYESQLIGERMQFSNRAALRTSPLRGIQSTDSGVYICTGCGPQLGLMSISVAIYTGEYAWAHILLLTLLIMKWFSHAVVKCMLNHSYTCVVWGIYYCCGTFCTNSSHTCRNVAATTRRYSQALWDWWKVHCWSWKHLPSGVHRIQYWSTSLRYMAESWWYVW